MYELLQGELHFSSNLPPLPQPFTTTVATSLLKVRLRHQLCLFLVHSRDTFPEANISQVFPVEHSL